MTKNSNSTFDASPSEVNSLAREWAGWAMGRFAVPMVVLYAGLQVAGNMAGTAIQLGAETASRAPQAMPILMKLGEVATHLIR